MISCAWTGQRSPEQLRRPTGLEEIPEHGTPDDPTTLRNCPTAAPAAVSWQRGRHLIKQHGLVDETRPGRKYGLTQERGDER